MVFFERWLADRAGPKPHVVATVVITGGSSGIGRCTAGLFARHGWRVGLIARGQAGLDAARADVERAGALAMTAPADVTCPDALEEAARAIERTLGPIAVWVNGAGCGTFGRFLDTPAEQFRRVTEVTYLGTVNGTRVALRHMVPLDRGCVINICSAVAFHGMPLLSSYSGAKHAVRGFDQAVRAELRQDGSRVRVVTVYPPAVNTPFFDHALSYMGRPGRPMPPVYQPEIVAAAIHLAATGRRHEMPVSFTTVLFGIGVRLTPGLIGLAILRLGYSGQLTDRPAALAAYRPTLHAPSNEPSPVHGSFGDEARRGSLHLTLLRFLARFGWPRRRSPAAAPSPAARGSKLPLAP